ncbi:hypothetical protein Ahy_B07g086240 isoform A [Arachis hypogaea]|uniref:Uncharacterized protein n=1 Tax=Arachis hypogaea TaxID=3818 RepID=A0A444Y969_ARAHY|nr:hypothetical protein Ahy_B07g086240 isoform A [Arachis hypogaea]
MMESFLFQSTSFLLLSSAYQNPASQSPSKCLILTIMGRIFFLPSRKNVTIIMIIHIYCYNSN